MFSYRIYLQQDILPGSEPVYVDKISFRLCSENVTVLLAEANHSVVPLSVRTKLQRLFRVVGPTIPHRNWTLLGDDFLSQVQMVKVHKVVFLVNMNAHNLNSWHDMAMCEYFVNT